MLFRCFNPKSKDFSEYGGRGITVCNRWLSFDFFYADMGDKPEGLTIERINNDGNYEPGNCRWATRKDQNRNKQNSKLFTYLGETKCLAAWAEEYGIVYATLWDRLKTKSFSEAIEYKHNWGGGHDNGWRDRVNKGLTRLTGKRGGIKP
jgi:hypothetical protein